MENQEQNQQPEGQEQNQRQGYSDPRRQPDGYQSEDTDNDQNDIAGNAGGNQQESGNAGEGVIGEESGTEDEEPQWEDDEEDDINGIEKDDDDELSVTD